MRNHGFITRTLSIGRASSQIAAQLAMLMEHRAFEALTMTLPDGAAGRARAQRFASLANVANQLVEAIGALPN